MPDEPQPSAETQRPTRGHPERAIAWISRLSKLTTTAVGVIAGVIGTLFTVLIFQQGRSDDPRPVTVKNGPLPVTVIDSVRHPDAYIVADVSDTHFALPVSLLDEWDDSCSRLKGRLDSLFEDRGGYSSRRSAIDSIFDRRCNSTTLYVSYYVNMNRLFEINMRNEGQLVARSVSVRVPHLTVAQWRKKGGDLVEVPYQLMQRSYSIEIGDIRPGESVLIQAWGGETFGDTLAVFLEGGRATINR